MNIICIYKVLYWLDKTNYSLTGCKAIQKADQQWKVLRGFLETIPHEPVGKLFPDIPCGLFTVCTTAFYIQYDLNTKGIMEQTNPPSETPPYPDKKVTAHLQVLADLPNLQVVTLVILVKVVTVVKVMYWHVFP